VNSRSGFKEVGRDCYPANVNHQGRLGFPAQQGKMKKELIKYFKSLGIEVYTNTKARGHQGFFLVNRIDISKHTKEERIIPTLLHEFSHYIHQKLEHNMVKTGGSLEVLFNAKCKVQNEKCNEEIGNREWEIERCEDAWMRRCVESENSHASTPLRLLSSELLEVTRFVDTNSHLIKLKEHKAQMKKKIRMQEEIIKKYYPKFMRSKKFKEFDKYIKKSKAKYLLKYDKVKFITPHILKILRREEFYSIQTIEQDFPDMPAAFCAYIRLKSAQKKQGRISVRINRMNKYYSKPTELFARFVEGFYIDEARVRALAPHSTQRFFELLEDGYYFELQDVFEMLQSNRQLATF